MPEHRTRTAPTVSVVIPFYGDPAPTQGLIRSLLDGPSQHLHEVIVSDDCSPTPFPATEGVSVVRRRRNGGFAQAVGSGARAATGDLLLILNSDLELPPAFLDSLIARARPWMPALVTTTLTSCDGHPSWSGRHFPRTHHYVTEWLLPLVRLRHLPLLHELVGHDTAADGAHDEVVDWAVGALMLLPTDTYRAVGGMDESFYMNCEEVDLQRRLRELCVPSVLLGGLSVGHEGGASSAPERRRGWLVDGRLRYARKWEGRAGARRLQAGLAAATAVNLVWNTARRLAGSPVRPVEVAREEYHLLTHPERWVPAANRAPARR